MNSTNPYQNAMISRCHIDEQKKKMIWIDHFNTVIDPTYSTSINFVIHFCENIGEWEEFMQVFDESFRNIHVTEYRRMKRAAHLQKYVEKKFDFLIKRAGNKKESDYLFDNGSIRLRQKCFDK
ncbi:hypothetical protein X798_02767 [Onchocerca flexuosa]|uniref:Uncharacterized protein n=1 Tax=Onchocerca flexuosa TaxID=387005 RepID=A0A238BY30_9BILA|nr:hypothetical protein X798_02767 [Onchocerca flexuosa]